jgi:hypothetical protein
VTHAHEALQVHAAASLVATNSHFEKRRFFQRVAANGTAQVKSVACDLVECETPYATIAV